MEPQQKQYRVIIYGEGGVGKNCIKYRSIMGEYIPGYDPYWGDEWQPYDIEVDGSKEKLQIYKVNADHDEYQPSTNSLIREYIKSADGFIFAYSYKDRKTFERLQELKQKITIIRENDEFPIVIIETKTDVGENDREVSPSEAKDLAAKWSGELFSTSAKENINVIEPFRELTRQMKKFQLKLDKKQSNKKKKQTKEKK